MDVGGRGSPDLVVGRWLALLDVARLRGDGFFGFGADVFLFVAAGFTAVFLVVAFWDAGQPRLPGRLSLAGSEFEAESTVNGSLALRGLAFDETSSFSLVGARERDVKYSRSIVGGDRGTGLEVGIGIREELFRSPGLRYILDVLDSLSAAISSGRRRSQYWRSSSVISSPPARAEEAVLFCWSS
jgi:hypothetical protein